MDPYQPFTGVLQLPGRAPYGTIAQVARPDGEPVAQIRTYRWNKSARFDILGPTGAGELLASGGRSTAWSRRGYTVIGPGDAVLMDVTMSALRPGAQVTLGDGAVLTVRGTWSGRKFEITDAEGAPVARIVTTSGIFKMRRSSLDFEVSRPVLSVVQAIGLTQCLRASLEVSRTAVANS